MGKQLVNISEFCEIVELNRSGRFALDTETSQSKEWIGVSLAWSPVHAMYLQVTPENKQQAIEAIRSIQYPVITHYGLYDYQVISRADKNKHLGRPFSIGYDTYCAYRLIWYDKREGFSLKALAESELSMVMVKIEYLLSRYGDMANVPIEELVDYACDDVIATYRLFEKSREAVVALKMKDVVLLESELQMAVVDMQDYGVLFDKSLMKEISQKIAAHLKELEKEFAQYLPGVCVSCTQPLSRGLFETLGLPTSGIRKGKSGFYSTDENTLSYLIDKHPVIPIILEWRKYNKLATTYTKSLMDLVAADGRIHATFDQFGAGTGRFSSSAPNLQNIPVSGVGREIRKCFVAAPGHSFMSFDYKQIELVILSVMAGDSKLQKAILNGLDLHRFTASRVLNKPMEEVTPEERSHMKAVNFSMVYGGGPSAFIEFTHGDWSKAQKLYDDYFEAFPELKKGIWNLKKSAYRGYNETYYHRRRAFTKIFPSDNIAQMSGKYRLAVNGNIQGTAADVIKFAMNYISRENLPAHLWAQIHDELIFEVEDSLIPKMYHAIKVLMSAVPFPVQFSVDCEVGKNWYDMSEYKGD